MRGVTVGVGLHLRPEAQVCAVQMAVAELRVLPDVELAASIEREVASNPALRAGGGVRGCASFDAGEAERLAVVEAPRELLLADVACVLPAADRWIAERVLSDLDGRGRLGRDAAAAARWLGVSVERMQRVLRAIRAHGAPDLAAADLREALLLQLDALTEVPPMVRRLVRDHLAELAHGRVPGVPEPKVQAALEFIRARLEPGSFDGAGGVPAPPADIVVRQGTDGRLETALVNALPVPEIDAHYARLAACPAGLAPREVALVRAFG